MSLARIETEEIAEDNGNLGKTKYPGHCTSHEGLAVLQQATLVFGASLLAKNQMRPRAFWFTASSLTIFAIELAPTQGVA
ncbi:hypothetical protein [Pseudomonas palleroniana]|uniref:hypothetical protein n=1 Tax=Pseudomonas TaxID=286 RepID=UPI001FD4209B|nr:hypothetical protein [Pseudomonas palleroniana]UOP13349.1 hypothetical protein LDL65_12595 [Pseudomonas palleroniana]